MISGMGGSNCYKRANPGSPFGACAVPHGPRMGFEAMPSTRRRVSLDQRDEHSAILQEIRSAKSTTKSDQGSTRAHRAIPDPRLKE